MNRFHSGHLFLGLVLAVRTSLAQAPPPAPPQEPVPDVEAARETDPTKSVFLSLRSEYFNLRAGDWRWAQILRSDRVWLRQKGWLGHEVGLITRLDLPIVARGAAGDTHIGLGDLYVQGLWVPWTKRNSALAIGSGLGLPTATQQAAGQGKWQVAPLFAPIWYFPNRRGLVLVKVQEYVSFAGNQNRPDVNYLLVTPTLLHTLNPRWWILVDTEAKTDWERDNRRSFKSGIQVGRVVSTRFAVYLKQEIPWGEFREGDFNLKFVLTWYRRRE